MAASTDNEPDRDDEDEELTTAGCTRETLEALHKLNEPDETIPDTVRAAVRALSEQEPERLDVDL